MKLGLLFAGQGSQKVGMGKDLYETYPVFRNVFDLLSEEDCKIAFEGPESLLAETCHTQPIMAAFAAGVLAVLREELGEENFTPQAVAGLSLGEYSALHSAGVWNAETLISLVGARGRFMTEAAAGTDCKMVAVLGLDYDKLSQACEQASAETSQVVQVANDNCPGQLVIAGEKKAVDRCAELAAELGARRCTELKVSGPFHTVFMEPAGRQLEKLFDETEFCEPRVEVVFNVKGDFRGEGESIKNLLVKQVSSGVKFTDTIRKMADCGIDTIIEIGPGKTLSGFVRKTASQLRCINVEDCESLNKAVELLRKELVQESLQDEGCSCGQGNSQGAGCSCGQGNSQGAACSCGQGNSQGTGCSCTQL